MSVVGGSNIIMSPDASMSLLSNGGFLSPEGRCHSFDGRADGYGKGEGFGVIIVKSLQRAIEDGDSIRSVIRGICANQDGRTPSLVQPRAYAQESLIHESYASAGLGLAATRYYEAHGTGTKVGDPLEAKAIGSAFREYRSNSSPLLVGSVKSNIGHLEAASGIAGVTKVTRMLETGIVPPNV